MSERDRRSDAGFTLPELLITMAVFGLVMVVLTAAITVVLRNHAAADGRLNVARGEQSIDTWMPADLASVNLAAKPAAELGDAPDPYGLMTGYDPVDQATGSTPCGGGWPCPGGLDLTGRNELLLTWRSLVAPGPRTEQTSVSYRFANVDGEYQLRRIACTGPVNGSPTCTSSIVLHRLPADWDMTATDELAFGEDDPDYANVAGQQVVVTIDGGLGARVTGAGGGVDTITLTAGGTSMETIEATQPPGSPSFVREGTRCGGSISILVDDSNSIGPVDMATVRTSVQSFIDAFRGTPVRLQVVRFGTTARVLGTGTNGDGFYDMSEPSQATALYNQINATNLSGNSGSSGGTNWEAAWNRALLSSGLSITTKPDTVVFFTDGMPTFWGRTNNEGNVNGSGSHFEREGFDKANTIASTFRRATPPSIIGVGVNGDGGALTASHAWDNPSGPNNTVYRTGQEILAHLVDGGNFVAVPYTGSNAEQANLYVLDQFEELKKALETVALKDCGGTVTIRTRLDDGTSEGQKFGPEVVYENQIDATTRTVATTFRFPTGTFDFEIATGSITTVVQPQVSSSMSSYVMSPRGWECRAGASPLTQTLVPLADPHFSGVSVTLNANQAASCTMWVRAA